MRACRLCQLYGHPVTPGAVFSGSSAAKVMVIGQAPGTTEVTAKRPFNAGSGRRLFEWFRAAGWDEDEFRLTQYMTAVTKCYPGPSRSGKGDRVPSRSEQALCRPFLEQEIRLIDPRLIILVGGLAIKLIYPAKARLQDVVGTAVYLPPGTAMLSPETAFDLVGILPAIDGARDIRGRWVVPLPHPSGASLWPNKPENRELISRAIQLLADLRKIWEL